MTRKPAADLVRINLTNEIIQLDVGGTRPPETRRTRRLTVAEWTVVLEAANAFEAEPANFEEDADDRRLEALRNAIHKMRERV